ncbi:MAG: polysaccharide biosynthesis tyrosine autokinase [Alloprevotella sp.]|nr:polysaccharide biosynthesis tyrosine autokinase [Alloprevotella sp.]
MNATSQAENYNTSQDSDLMNLQDHFFLCLSQWRWILLSVFLCCGIALWHILTTQPVYQRTATIMIKDDSNSSMINGSVGAVFSDMGVGVTESNVYNEMLAIQAPALLTETGKRLDYNVNYEKPGTFHSIPLYGEQLPVKVIFHSLTPEDFGTLTLTLKGTNSFELSEFTYNGEEDPQERVIKGRFNTMINTPLGKITVLPTAGLRDYLEDNRPIAVSRSDYYSMTNRIGANLSTNLAETKGTLIAITFSDVLPQRAEDVINTLLDVYKEKWVEDKNQMTIATSKFITERLGVIERELGDVDQNISSYKSSHLLPDVKAASGIYMQMAQENASEIMKLNTQKAIATFVQSFLKENVKNNQLLPVNTGIDNRGIELQINEYNNTLLDRNNLVTNSSEKNPLLATYDQKLESLRSSLLSGINNLIVSLNTQIKHWEQSENRTSEQIASNPEQAKYLQAVGREQKVKEALYLFLLQKREENELSQAFTAYNTRIISPPCGSIYPVSPVRRNIMLIAFAIGLAIPIGLIYLRESLDTKLRGRKDLENVKVPFVGEIPFCKNRHVKRGLMFWKKKSETGRHLVVKAGVRNVVNEAFRIVRTNLEFMLRNSDGKVILITSFNPGSGKSFITMNMASSFALKGKRVLVIDGDLRHGTSSKYVGSPEEGLCDYLSGQVDNVQRVIVQDYHNPTLYVLPIGTMPPNPTELLQNERMTSAVSELRQQFDYVFIDCPPIEVVADTQILAPMADRTIFIVRTGLLERSMISEIDKLYDSAKYPNMSLILNGSKGHGDRHGYRYRYGYGYGYGYGYHYGGDEK